ncbi:MAG TPA: hypothetical protein VG692_00980 [Gemmatimonadales bacterium]|nr:hypothetical protein [Gemmatimonadales bacterium]
MALDQSLLDLAERTGEGFFRLYTWSPSCLSFGRNEPALRRYDRGRIEALGLDVVRRPTGGRAVWHAGELTYAVAAPCHWFGTLTEAYCAIHRRLAEAVSRLGATATLAGTARAAGIGTGACFASPAGGEVLVRGRKLIGSAQLRQGTAFLQHGSILIRDDQRMVAGVTRGDAPAGGEITLDAALGRRVDPAEVVRVVAEAFDGMLGPRAELPPPDPAHLARFRDPAWTWRR